MKSICPVRQAILDFLSSRPKATNDEIFAHLHSNSPSTSKYKAGHALRRLLKYNVLKFKNGSYSVNPSVDLSAIPEEALYETLCQNPLTRDAIKRKFKWTRSQTESSIVALRSRKLVRREGDTYSTYNNPKPLNENPQLSLPFPNEIPFHSLVKDIKRAQHAFANATKTANSFRAQADNLIKRADAILSDAQHSLDEAKGNLRKHLGDLI